MRSNPNLTINVRDRFRTHVIRVILKKVPYQQLIVDQARPNPMRLELVAIEELDGAVCIRLAAEYDVNRAIEHSDLNAGVVLRIWKGSMRLTHKKTVISHELCTHF